MSRVIFWVASSIGLLSGGVIVPLSVSQTSSVAISDPRPVAKAVDTLERIYGIPITYEDPIVVHPDRLEDISDKVQLVPDFSHRVIVQKNGILSFTYKPPIALPSLGGDPQQLRAETEEAVYSALVSILRAYAASGGPESFEIKRGEEFFQVVPIDFLNGVGRVEHTSPILDKKITIVPKRRTRQDLLLEVCDSLTQTTGVHVGVGVVPVGGMNMETAISGKDLPARLLLVQLLAELSSPQFQGGTVISAKDSQSSVSGSAKLWSWHLFYAPGFGFALNIHQVVKTGQF